MLVDPLEIQQVVASWKRKTEYILEAKVNKKGLRDSGSLADSTGNIVWKIGADQLTIVVTIAEHGRYLDMKKLRGKKNRNRWGYAKTLWSAVSVLQDEITILMADKASQHMLDALVGDGNI